MPIVNPNTIAFVMEVNRSRKVIDENALAKKVIKLVCSFAFTSRKDPNIPTKAVYNINKGIIKVVATTRVTTKNLKGLKLGFSFQNSALYDSMTVRENLEFPLVRNRKNLDKAEVGKAVEEVLDAVGLSQTISQMPSELSGGQRKRIGIARTLILQPEIMLYDEPTAGLDPITCIEINNLINEVQERYHTSSIIITHDLTCAKATGDRVAMMLDGKFVRQGSFEAVFDTEDERIKSFFEYNFIQG